MRDWILPGQKINDPQQRSLSRLISLCAHAHYVDVIVRINGKDERYEADWIKHMEPQFEVKDALPPLFLAPSPVTTDHIPQDCEKPE